MNRRRRNQELDEEIRGHLTMAAQDRIARGENPEQAARNARRELGNQAPIQEITRAMWGWAAMERQTPDYLESNGYSTPPGTPVQRQRLEQPVAVISSRAARYLWPEGNPIGRHVQGSDRVNQRSR